MKVERMKWITRQIVRDNPKKIFLFGDNRERRGYGGQAKEMRGEPNAIGIAVKHAPTTRNSDYYSDRNYYLLKSEMDGDFHKIEMRKPSIVVIPEDGIGTGLAELDKRAPRLFRYLQFKLEDLKFL